MQNKQPHTINTNPSPRLPTPKPPNRRASEPPAPVVETSAAASKNPRRYSETASPPPRIPETDAQPTRRCSDAGDHILKLRPFQLLQMDR